MCPFCPKGETLPFVLSGKKRRWASFKNGPGWAEGENFARFVFRHLDGNVRENVHFCPRGEIFPFFLSLSSVLWDGAFFFAKFFRGSAPSFLDGAFFFAIFCQFCLITPGVQFEIKLPKPIFFLVKFRYHLFSASHHSPSSPCKATLDYEAVGAPIRP